MREHDGGHRTGPEGMPPAPLERTGQDGLAGTGDMLGGLSAGVGGRLGPDDGTGTRPTPPNRGGAAEVVLPVDADVDPSDPA